MEVVMKATRKGNRFLSKPLFLMGMLVIVAALGLMVAGCDDGNDNNNNNGGDAVSLAVSSDTPTKTLTLTLTGLAWKTSTVALSSTLWDGMIDADIFDVDKDFYLIPYAFEYEYALSDSNKTLTVTISGGTSGDSITFTPKSQLENDGSTGYFISGTIPATIPITGSEVTFTF
jgi:hypothetical protein